MKSEKLWEENQYNLGAMNNINLKIEYVDPKLLEPSPYNPRAWSEVALKGLRASIAEFGICDPFIVNKRKGLRLVGGHMRCRVAIELGIEQVPIVFVDLSDKKEKVLNVALNNPHIAGNWDFNGLDCLLDEINTDSEELFNNLNFTPLLEDISNAELPQIDNEPIPQEPSTDDDWIPFKIGDIKGKVFKDVYALFQSEWERLQGITGSENITPNLEAMIVNSANTPRESLV